MKRGIGTIISAEYDKNGFWFILRDIPLICYFSYEDNKITVQKSLPSEQNDFDLVYSDMKVVGDNIFIVPRKGKYFLKYSKSNDDIEVIKKLEDSGNYIKLFVYNKKLYAFSENSGNIAVINDGETEIIKDSCNLIASADVINDYCQYKDSVYCVIWKKNIIVRYSLHNDLWEMFYMGDIDGSFTQIKECCGAFYIYDDKNNSILKINTVTASLEKEIKLDGNCKSYKMHVLDDKYILMDAIRQSDVHIFDKDLSEIKNEKINMPYKFCFGVKISGQDNTLFMPDGSLYSIINGALTKINQVEFEWIDDKVLCEYIEKSNVIPENELMSLEDLINKL